MHINANHHVQKTNHRNLLNGLSTKRLNGFLISVLVSTAAHSKLMPKVACAVNGCDNRQPQLAVLYTFERKSRASKSSISEHPCPLHRSFSCSYVLRVASRMLALCLSRLLTTTQAKPIVPRSKPNSSLLQLNPHVSQFQTFATCFCSRHFSRFPRYVCLP
ncbi:hypothetical protein BKA81DRAFT_179934 [Phyllosticta paracitricarpa]